jgi:sensor histidine kinase YesM
VKGYNFIFSNKLIYRLLRHIAFWVVFIFHYSAQNSLIGGPNEAMHFRSFPNIIQYDMFFVPAFILSAYFFMYVIIPVFLFQRKIAGFILSFSALLLVNIIAAYFTSIQYVHVSMSIPYEKINFDLNKYDTIVDGFWIPFIVMGLSGGIRLTKKWVLQQKANDLLIKQKISRELKLLKTQIHPRFLFNSLISLEDKLKKKQIDSPGFILKLANILSYVLYESDGDHVLLAKEIEVILEYMDLQKDNFPDTLYTSLDIDIPAYDLYIAPLILLPFLETSFEYLTVNNYSHKNITLNIKTDDETLFFDLTCFEESPSENSFFQKPGWSDITKRIENLYPDNHQLILKSSTNGIQIELQLKLVRSLNQEHAISLPPKISYEFS